MLLSVESRNYLPTFEFDPPRENVSKLLVTAVHTPSEISTYMNQIERLIAY